jgi:hypothetical protein
MPLYTADPDSYPGATFPPEWPCKVIDGAGEEVPGCLLADTDTGRVIREVWDADGNPVVDHAASRIATIAEIRPLPLRLVPPDWIDCHVVEAAPADAD